MEGHRSEARHQRPKMGNRTPNLTYGLTLRQHPGAFRDSKLCCGRGRVYRSTLFSSPDVVNGLRQIPIPFHGQVQVSIESEHKEEADYDVEG